MSYRRSLRYSVPIATAAALSVLWPSCLPAESNLEQHLSDQYKGKTLVLRNFYSVDRLRYDSAGMPTWSADSGDWTVGGFVRVSGLGLSGHRLTIQADRLSVVNGGQGFEFQQGGKKKAKKASRVRIEVEVDSSITAEKAGAALSRIFLTTQDRIADEVPEYWKPCVLAASTGKGGSQYAACSFPREFAAIPGVVYNFNESSELDQAAARLWKASDSPHPRIGKDVTPPKVVSQKDPDFSEDARHAKYQGTVVLSLTVDKTGQTRDIRIVRPLGFGLDREAARAVSTWRFKPAKKDGEPIDMDIAVEVDFHLY